MKIIRRIGKILLYLLIGLLTLFVIVALVIQYPSVQTRLTQKVSQVLSDQLQAEFKVGRVDIDFFKTAVLEDIFIADQQQDTLLYAGRLGVDIGLFNLMQSEIYLNSIKLENAYVNLYQRQADSTFNYQFLIDNFTSTTPSEPSTATPWTFGLGKVVLENARFDMLDEADALSDLQMQVTELVISIDEFDLEKQAVALQKLEMEDSKVVYHLLQKDTAIVENREQNTPLAFPSFGWTITANKIRLANNEVAYWDDNFPQLENALDYGHLDLKKLNLALDDLQLADDGILMKLKNASFIDQSGFELQNLEGGLAVLPDGISIEDLILETPNSHFQNNADLTFNAFNDLTAFLEKVKFQFQFSESYLAVNDLLMIAPQIRDVPNLNLPEDEKLNMEGSLSYAAGQLNLENLFFSIGEMTRLNASGSIGQLLGEQPSFDLQIKELATSYQSLKNYTKDIELPEGLDKFGKIELSGKISGTTDELQATGLRLTTETATRFTGDLKIKGMSNMDRAIFDLKINDLATRSTDLSGFSESPFPPQLDSLGLIQFTGNYKGTLTNFMIDGGFKTTAGDAITDLEIDFTPDYSNASYKGRLRMENFDLGRVLLDTTQFGRVSLDLTLDGQGLAIDSLDTTLEGVVSKAVFNNYQYTGLQVDGRLIKRLFEGELNSADSNFTFDLVGKVNFNDSLPDMNATVRLDTINLKNLNLSTENIGLSGLIEAEIRGNNIDNLDGRATWTDLVVSNEDKIYRDSKVSLEARQLAGGIKALIFDAEFLKANIEGEYNFSDLPDLAIGYINDFFPIEELALPLDSLLTPRPQNADQQFEFNFQFPGLESLAKVLVPDFEKLDSSAYLKGRFDSATKDLEMTGLFTELVVQGIELDSFKIKFNGNRKRLKSEISLKNLNLNNTFYAPHFDLNTRLGEDTLKFGLEILDESYSNIFKWGGKATELPLDYQLVLDEVMLLNEEKWEVDRNNKVFFNAKNITINNLAISKDDQTVSINSIGEASLDDLAPMKLQFNHFSLAEISALFNNPSLQLNGDMNGQFTIKEPKKNLHYNANIQVNDLTLNEEKLGTLNIEASQSRGEQVIDLLTELKGNNQLLVKGTYDVAANKFNVSADIDRLSLVTLDPFLNELIRNSEGYLKGDFILKGTPDAPALNGKITTKDISTHLILTGTRYRTNENTITFSEKEINLGELIIYDPSNRPATVSGRINHDYFSNITFDLQAQTDGIKILNTSRKDNPLYYGRLFASADVRISGTPDVPKLNVIATTKDSSLLHVEPLVAELAVVQEDYIIFANPNTYEPENLNELEQRVGSNSVGFDLNLTLIVTPAARLNVIIDPLTGDELFCSGNGNFTIRMNPAGDLNIVGTYEIEEGNYSFAYEGLVKRNFEIRKGSSLSFTGDPYNARFDITAVYKTRATTYELISNEVTLDEATLASSQRRADVEVLLNIDGDLDEPEISFDILLPQSQGSAVDNLVARKLSDLRESPTELNKQVFGLLFFNSFIQSETGGGLANVGENAALRSVSGLISTQLNRLANRFVKGVDVTLGFDSYKTTGQEAGTVSELQVGLSKQLFNNRLTIQVGGNFNLENSEQSSLEQGGYSSIAGDFVLEYKLNEQGNYLLKVFHKSDYNALLGGNTNKTGVGIGYRKSY